MADIRIRSLDEDVKRKLRSRGAAHGRSMEAEARQILTDAVSDPDDRPDLFDTLIERFGALGGVTITIPNRQPVPAPATQAASQPGPAASASIRATSQAQPR